jgi:hypothetical protein
VLPLLAAVLAATNPSASSSSPLEASIPWFERITVTVDDKGKQQSCKYQFSLSDNGPEQCDEAMAASISGAKAGGSTGTFSKLTFERRFSPGAKLDSGRLQTGDTLLGQQVMFLTFGDGGAIASCRIVGKSGDMVPAYGCDEAKSEQFKLNASASSGTPSQAFMTIMVYGHQEQLA